MTSQMRLRLAKLATLLGGATLLWACNAPPVVVPPPDSPYTPDVVFTSELLTDAAGQQTMVWTGSQPTKYTPAAGATFFIYDLNINEGVIQKADSDGKFTTTPAWAGAINDQMSIYFLMPAGGDSKPLCLLLTEGASITCPP